MQSTIRWGIMGSGSVAKDFARALRQVKDAQLLAVGSRTATNAAVFAREFTVPRSYSDYEELANDRDIDVVYVATPSTKHKEHCLLSLNAGKAVLCEKPFTVDAAEAREVIGLARQRRLFCMEAMWMRFLPVMARLRELLNSGAIGEVRMLTADLGFAAPYNPTNRFFNADLGGGAFLDLGIYPLSLAFFLLGAPDHVLSEALVGPTGVDEDAVAVLSYASGTLAVLSASMRGHLPCEGLIVGTRGQIRIHSPLYRPHRLSLRTHAEPVANVPPDARSLMAWAKNNPVMRAAFFRCEGLVKWLLQSRPTTITVPFSGNGYNYEAIEVIRCLHAGDLESKVMPLDETLKIMSVMDMIRSKWKRSHSPS